METSPITSPYASEDEEPNPHESRSFDAFSQSSDSESLEEEIVLKMDDIKEKSSEEIM